MPASPARPRDPRLDFFRGIAMFIILIAHTPGNPWTLWIPARFGFSDATEIFVFCSGMASAIAFGRVFDHHGLAMGTARIAHRVWQVYWAHIATFIVIAALMVALNAAEVSERDYIARLNLYPFFNNLDGNLVGLLTLTYVPNYFDILPMYLVILALVPVVMALSRISPWLVAAMVGLLWLWANADNYIAGASPLQMPAQYWFEPPNNTRPWFFNPFGWQLVFFTGFALMRGWLRPPPVTWWLVAIAAAVVLLSVPLAYYRIRREDEALQDAWSAIQFLRGKTDFGILRYLHFLALAYLAWVAVGPAGSRLQGGALKEGAVTVVRRVGQQSLAVFVTSLVLARILGVAFDVWGREPLLVAAVNLFGAACLIATAYLVGWIKGQPWRRAAAADATTTPTAMRGRTA